MTIKKIKTTIVLAATVMLAAIPLNSNAQFAATITPGLGLNSACFGYQVNENLIPFVSFQYGSFGIQYTETSMDLNPQTNVVEETSYAMKLNGGIMLPGVGVKYFIAKQQKLKAYAIASIIKPTITGSLEEDGVVNKDVEEGIKAVKLTAGELGLGAEYFFDNNFSVGGEFGVRLLSGKFDDSYESEYYDPILDEYVPTPVNVSTKVGMQPTYTKFTLNFYFNRK